MLPRNEQGKLTPQRYADSPRYREIRLRDRNVRVTSNLPLRDFLTQLDQHVEEPTTVYYATLIPRGVIAGGFYSEPTVVFSDGEIVDMNYHGGDLVVNGGTYTAGKGSVAVEEETPSWYLSTTMKHYTLNLAIRGLRFQYVILRPLPRRSVASR